MMKNEIKEFLEESVNLELVMCELYQFFHAKFPRDAQFWWKLSMEELNHASLIKSISDLFFPEGIIPLREIELQTAKMREIIEMIHQKILKFNQAKLTRNEAFLYAFELENSAGEIHFELFMNELPSSQIEKIFQKLNGEDKNHAIKIHEYMQKNGIG